MKNGLLFLIVGIIVGFIIGSLFTENNAQREAIAFRLAPGPMTDEDWQLQESERERIGFVKDKI